MYCVCCRDLDPIQGQGQGHGAFELPTTSEGVHAGGDDRSPLAGLSGLGRAFPASRAQHVSDLHSKFALGPHHVSKYGRHPNLRPLRLGDERKRKKKETTGQKYNVRICYAGRP